METWFVKSAFATASIVPAFLAIPFFKSKYDIDPLVFLVWYFGATATSIALFWLLSGRASELVPGPPQLLTIIAIGLVFGALANGFLFQAIGMAPNPGLPPVVYATSSVLVFVLSIALASTLPGLFRPVVTDISRLVGIGLVLLGLYLLAGGKFSGPT